MLRFLIVFIGYLHFTATVKTCTEMEAGCNILKGELFVTGLTDSSDVSMYSKLKQVHGGIVLKDNTRSDMRIFPSLNAVYSKMFPQIYLLNNWQMRYFEIYHLERSQRCDTTIVITNSPNYTLGKEQAARWRSSHVAVRFYEQSYGPDTCNVPRMVFYGCKKLFGHLVIEHYNETDGMKKELDFSSLDAIYGSVVVRNNRNVDVIIKSPEIVGCTVQNETAKAAIVTYGNTNVRIRHVVLNLNVESILIPKMFDMDGAVARVGVNAAMVELGNRQSTPITRQLDVFSYCKTETICYYGTLEIADIRDDSDVYRFTQIRGVIGRVIIRRLSRTAIDFLNYLEFIYCDDPDEYALEIVDNPLLNTILLPKLWDLHAASGKRILMRQNPRLFPETYWTLKKRFQMLLPTEIISDHKPQQHKPKVENQTNVWDIGQKSFEHAKEMMVYHQTRKDIVKVSILVATIAACVVIGLGIHIYIARKIKMEMLQFTCKDTKPDVSGFPAKRESAQELKSVTAAVTSK